MYNSTELIMQNNSALEKILERRVLDLEQIAEYFKKPADTIKDWVDKGKMSCMDRENYTFSVSDISKFELGIHNTVTKNSATVHETLTVGALEYAHNNNLIEDITEEEFNMAVQKYGEGSIYYNERRKCYQMAFYMEVGGEKKRKIVSGTSENDVISKRALIVNSMGPVIGNAMANTGIIRKTVSEALDEYLTLKEPRVSAATYQSDYYMGKHIHRLIGGRYLNELTKMDVQIFINNAAIKDGQVMSEKLVKKVKILFNEVVEHGIDNKYLLSSPVRNIKLPKCKKTDKDSKFLSVEQIARLLDLVSDNLKYYTIIYVLANTGLRINELLSLKWSDIINDNGKYALDINKALSIDKKRRYIEGDTKSESSVRSIPISGNVIEILEKWRDSFTDKDIELRKMNNTSEYIFCNRYGKIIQYDNFRCKFKEYLERHGKKDDERYIFHSLRHSYASLLKHGGHGKEEISDLMGHADSDITEKVYITEVEQKVKYESLDIMTGIMEDIEKLRKVK